MPRDYNAHYCVLFSAVVGLGLGLDLHCSVSLVRVYACVLLSADMVTLCAGLRIPDRQQQK